MPISLPADLAQLANVRIARVAVRDDGMHFLPLANGAMDRDRASKALVSLLESQGLIVTYVTPQSDRFPFGQEQNPSLRLDPYACRGEQIDIKKLKIQLTQYNDQQISVAELTAALIASQNFKRKEVAH